MATQRTRVVIETEGGEDLVKQLRESEAAARQWRGKVEEAFRSAGQEAQKVPRHLKAVNAASRELRDEAASLTGRLGVAGTALKALGPAGIVVGAAAAGLGLVTAGMLAGAKRAIEFASALQDQAGAANLSTKAFQEYVFVFGQAGIRQEKAAQALQTFNRVSGQAREGTGALVTTLKDSDRAFLDQLRSITSTEGQLDLLIDRLADTEDAQERVVLASAAFGSKVGPAIANAVKGGAEGVRALREQARLAGAVLSADLIETADRAGDRLDQLASVIKVQLSQSFLGLAPLIESVAVKLLQGAAAAGQFVDRFFGITRHAQASNLKDELERLLATRERLQSGNVARGDPGAEQVEAEIKRLTAEYKALTGQIRTAEKAQQDLLSGTDTPPPLKSDTAAAEKELATLREVEKLRGEALVAGLEGEELLRAERERTLTAFEAQAAEELAKSTTTAEQRLKIEQALAEGRLLINEQFEKKVADFRADQAAKDADAAKRDAERITQQLTQEQQRQAQEFAQPFANAFESIQQAGADALVGAFEAGENAGDAMFESLLAAGKRFAAEMLQILTLRLLIQPVVNGVAGGLGGVGGGGGSLVGGLAQSLLGQAGSSALGGVTGGSPSGGVGSFLSSLLGFGGTGATAVAGLSVVPTSTTGVSAIVQGGTVIALQTASGIVPIEGGASLASAGVVPAGAGASLGAAAASAGIAAGIAGAIINTYGLIDAGDPARLRGHTLQGGTALAGAIPLVSAIQNFRYGHTGEGIADLLLPSVFQSIRAFTQEGPSLRDLAFESVAKSLDKITASRFFTPGTDAIEGGFRQRQAGRAAIRDDETLDFLARLIGRDLSRESGFGPRGISSDFRTLIEGGLARAQAAGRDPFEVAATIVRRLFTFDQAIAKLNRQSLQGFGGFVPAGSVGGGVLKPGLTRDEFLERAEILIRVYERELPAAIDASVVAVKTLERELLLTAEGIKREANRQSRALAEESGELQFEEPDEDFIRRARRKRFAARHSENEDQRENAQDDLAGLEAGLGVIEEAVDALGRTMESLVSPSALLRHAFGDIQVALNEVNVALANPAAWDQLPELMGDAISAVDAWGEAIAGTIDQLRAVEDAERQRRLALGLEIAELRGTTDVSGLFNVALADTQARFLKAESAGARLAAVENLIAIERSKAEAAIRDLVARSPLAGIADDVRAEIGALRVSLAGEGVPGFNELARQLTQAQADFRTAPDEERAAAAGRVRELIGATLGAAGETFGTGSARFAAAQEQAIAQLEAILTASEADEKRLRDDVRAIRETLADRLDTLGTIASDISDVLASDLRSALIEAGLTPEEIEAAVADPVTAQLLIANEQKELLEQIEANTRDFRNETQLPNTTNNYIEVNVNVREGANKEEVRRAADEGTRQALLRAGYDVRPAA